MYTFRFHCCLECVLPQNWMYNFVTGPHQKIVKVHQFDHRCIVQVLLDWGLFPLVILIQWSLLEQSLFYLKNNFVRVNFKIYFNGWNTKYLVVGIFSGVLYTSIYSGMFFELNSFPKKFWCHQIKNLKANFSKKPAKESLVYTAGKLNLNFM